MKSFSRLSSNARIAVFLLLAVTQSNLFQPVHGSLICFVFSTPRCFLGLGAIMRRGTPGEGDCVETCALIFLAIFNFFQGYSCGACDQTGLLIPQENDPNSFGLDVYGVNIPDSDKQAFIDAATTWNNVITLDTQGPYSFQALENLQPANDLLPGCAYPTNGVDDLFICADIREIDGVGKVLGAAAPVRRDSRTARPFTGFMYFDVADVALLRSQGLFDTVILHEMGHIIGLGTIWVEKGIQDSGGSCPYKGPRANAAYQRLTGCPNSARTEQNGGEGSRCSHWMENSCLANELMSSQLSSNSILTSITIGSLEDMGYPVDYTANQDVRLSQFGCCRRRDLQGLDLEEPPPPRRKMLSDEARKTAVDYGQKILYWQDQAAKARGSTDLQDQTYGVVNVMMLEDDTIFDVMVTRDGAI